MSDVRDDIRHLSWIVFWFYVCGTFSLGVLHRAIQEDIRALTELVERR